MCVSERIPVASALAGVDEQLELRTECDGADAQSEAAEQLHRIVDTERG